MEGEEESRRTLRTLDERDEFLSKMERTTKGALARP